MITPEGRSNSSIDAESQAKEARFVSPYAKIVEPEAAKGLIRNWQNQNQRVVMVDAVLDIPHFAHAEYFLACANLGDRLALRVNSDAFVTSRKDHRGPIVPFQERAMHAAHYPYIDVVTSKDEGGWGWLEAYKPDIIVKSTTSGKAVRDEIDQVRAYLEELGTELVIMDEYHAIVLLDQAHQRGVEYESRKLTSERISGSIIKAEIVRRAQEDGVIVDFTQNG